MKDTSEGAPFARIQRSREKGSKLPPNTVCVSRGTVFGNPFVSKDPAKAVAKAVAAFRAYLDGSQTSFLCDPQCILGRFFPLSSGRGPIAVGIKTVRRDYLARLMTLPGLLLAAREGSPEAPLYFKFAGGEGLLNPMITLTNNVESFHDLQFATIEEVKE